MRQMIDSLLPHLIKLFRKVNFSAWARGWFVKGKLVELRPIFNRRLPSAELIYFLTVDVSFQVSFFIGR